MSTRACWRPCNDVLDRKLVGASERRGEQGPAEGDDRKILLLQCRIQNLFTIQQ